MTISIPLYFQYIVWCLLLAYKNIIIYLVLFTFDCMDMSDSLASRVFTVVIVGDGSVANKWLQWSQINGF